MTRYHDEFTVIRPGNTAGAYGSTELDWDTAARTTYPAWFGPGRTTESPGGADPVRGDARVHLPPTADVQPGDRGEHWDQLYDVEGQPALVMRRGQPHHYEVDLTYVV